MEGRVQFFSWNSGKRKNRGEECRGGKKMKHTSLPWKHYSSPTHPERKPYRTRPTLQELNKIHDSPTSLPVISQRMEHNAERCSENNYRNMIHCKQIKCNFTGKDDKPVQMMLEKLRNFIWIQYSVRFNTCFKIFLTNRCLNMKANIL